MNYLIGHALNRNRVTRPEQGGNLCGSDRGISCEPNVNSTGAQSLRDTSLPWEILETARFYFQKKGFEKTTILNICMRLGIKKTQFHKHFKSLDEVLEVLWAM